MEGRASANVSYEAKLERVHELTLRVQQGASLSETLDAAREGAQLLEACMSELDRAEGELASIFAKEAPSER